MSKRADRGPNVSATRPEPHLGSWSGLAVAATPIGNLGDSTLRLIDALGRADLVICEDTRVTRKLLAAHGIRVRLAAYHDHNAERVRPGLLARLARGERLLLVSDAGTPLVSDPGFKLVEAAIAAGIAVTALPGPSAPLAALVVAGLPTDRFYFGGFPGSRQAERRRRYGEVAGLDATLVFLESAQRLAASLGDAAAALGDRPAAVARELTKRFEEVRRGRLAELAAHYQVAGPPKGEVVVVIGPPEAPPPATADAVDDLLRRALADAGVRDAARIVAEETGLPRKELYRRALSLAGREPGRSD